MSIEYHGEQTIEGTPYPIHDQLKSSGWNQSTMPQCNLYLPTSGHTMQPDAKSVLVQSSIQSIEYYFLSELSLSSLFEFRRSRTGVSSQGTVGSNPTLSAITSEAHYIQSGAQKIPQHTDRGWDLNRGSEGDISPSWGDRSHAKARGGWSPSGSAG